MVKHITLLNRIVCLILLAGFSQVLPAADIVARTDRANIGVNESFTLVFESTESIDGDPDFTPLHEDFDILNTTQSSNVSIVNGRMTRNQTWTLRLFPKRSGKVTIPEVSFGKDKSPALMINISEQAADTANTGKDIFFEVNAEPKSAYIQQQIVYTVKLYRAVATNNAGLTEPEINSTDTISLRLGEDSSYDTVVNGRRYAVFERQYVLFPQKPGKLTIPALQFTGSISSARHGLFDFDTFGRGGQMVRERSEPVEIEVKPIPAEFKGRHWLPAESLQLSEDWSPDPPVFTVGEPMTRSITLTAVGLTAAQLPEFNMRIPAELKQYPDQPGLQDTANNQSMIGTRVEKLALIPTQPGRYTLPAIEIPWWNTQAQKQEIARLPTRVIEVAPAANTPASTSVSASASTSESAAGSSTAAATGTSTIPPSSGTGIWPWLSLLLALGWLLTLILWWRSAMRRRNSARQKPAAEKKPDPDIALKRLRIACKDNDPLAAKQALLQWAQALWPDGGMHNLNAIAGKTGDRLAAQIRLLSDRLYRPGESEWQGNELWLAVENWKSPEELNGSSEESALQPLHKIRTG
jgi:hypothetical protein